MFFTPLYCHHGNNLQRKERTARIRQFERLFNSHSCFASHSRCASQFTLALTSSRESVPH